MGKAGKGLISISITLAMVLGVAVVPAQAALNLGPSSLYIIKVSPSARVAIELAVKNAGGSIEKKYQYAFDGYVVKMPNIAAAILSKIPNILTVEKDAPMNGLNIQQYQTPTPSWGIDRIDQKTIIPSSDSTYTSSYGYRSAGAGSVIYVGDTGVYPHDDLVGRISTVGYDGFADGMGVSDCNGHGTHVATTAAGSKYGVAKNATVVPVRLLNCAGSGSYSGVIAALDWILSPSNTNSKSNAVLNLSIGGGKSSSVNEAITRLTNAGIAVVVAAGNSNLDACNYSPASAASAITVGSTTVSDAKSSFSNWGSCVDVHAPGSNITAGWYTSASAINNISGTSMAAPHVAGAVAVYRGLNPTATVEQITAYIDSQATASAITGLPAATVNKLLYVSPTDGGPAIVAPTVALKSLGTISHNNATINLNVNPNNAPTQISLEYSTDQGMATGVLKAIVTPDSATGSNLVSAVATLSQLTASTTYYFRAIGVNESGQTISSIGSFKTAAPPAVLPAPAVSPATDITAYSATLNGVVLPGNASTNLTFVYSTDATFATNAITAVATPNTVSGSASTNVLLNLSYLNGSTTYYFRLVATNSTGSVTSSTSSFKTLTASGIAPAVTTNQSPFTATITNITGSVNPQGQTTTVKLIMGREKSLTVSPIIIEVPGSPFTGVSTINISAPSTTLIPGIRFYYSFQASNAAGMTKANIMSNVLTLAPVIISNRTSMITLDSTKLHTVMNGGASNTRNSFIWGTNALLDSATAEITGTPFAVTNNVNNEIAATLTGLKPFTTYYYRAKILAYTGPLAGAGPLLGPIYSFTTLALATPTPTPTPTPRVDTQLPVIVSGLVNPQNVEVCKTVSEMSVKATDNFGIARVDLRIYGPTMTLIGQLSAYLKSGTKTSGTWGNDWVVPCSSATGKYQVDAKVTDEAGNATAWGTLPNFWVQPASIQDKSAPVFVSGSISATSIKVGGTISEITARITDDLGVLSVDFSLASPAGSIISTMSAFRKSGTKTDGIYRNDWALNPAYAPGKYGIYVEAIDEWKKSSGLKLIGTIDLVADPVVTPTPKTKLSQSITFSSLLNRILGGAATSLQAIASSKLQVSYATSTPTVCQILDLGKGRFSVQYLVQKFQPDVSTCTIIASQPGDDVYNAAQSVTRSFTYSKGASKVTLKQPASITTNGVYIYGMVASTTPLEVTTTSPDICSVNDLFYTYTQDGTRATLRAVKNGNCVIKFTFPGDSHLLGSSLTWSSQVSGVSEIPVGSNTAQGITFAPIADREYGPGLYLKATTTSGLPITYKSLTPKICQILAPTEGIAVQAAYPLSGLDVANCIVEASQPGDNRFAPAISVQRSFNWIKADMKITLSRSTSLVGKGPHTVDASVSFVDISKMGGLRSLGHPLAVTSATPTVCTVISTAPSDQSRGIYSRSMISAVSNGRCTLTFNFIGTADRRATSLSWNSIVSRI